MTAPTSLEVIGTVLFFLAVLHTFLVRQFQSLAARFPEGSVGENFFHVLGEVEVVFGLWAGVAVLAVWALSGLPAAIRQVESLNFTEPVFVFVVMTIAATRSVVRVATRLVTLCARLVPVRPPVALYVMTLVVGPLLGSVITEPAAMTVTALILRERYFEHEVSARFRYVSLAVLFVNVSIGGVLTHFAAPPVLMVASGWSWDTPFMLTHFGWKTVLGVLTNATLAAWLLSRELKESGEAAHERGCPVWLTVANLTFLGLVILTSHHPAFFVGVFLFFLGVAKITSEYQDELKLKESLLVGFFLGGLVVLGSFQTWWLSPLIPGLPPLGLFTGAAAFTAFLDNAALTYLASRVPSLDEALRYAVVAGAVAGGGLTVIANAPNPAGYSLLSPTFGPEGVHPGRLLAYAVPPTCLAMLYFWLL